MLFWKASITNWKLGWVLGKFNSKENPIVQFGLGPQLKACQYVRKQNKEVVKMFLNKHRPKMAPKPLESRLEIKCKSS